MRTIIASACLLVLCLNVASADEYSDARAAAILSQSKQEVADKQAAREAARVNAEYERARVAAVAEQAKQQKATKDKMTKQALAQQAAYDDAQALAQARARECFGISAWSSCGASVPGPGAGNAAAGLPQRRTVTAWQRAQMAIDEDIAKKNYQKKAAAAANDQTAPGFAGFIN